VKNYVIPTVFLVLAVAGCATHYAPEATADPYGFLAGLWHGLVFPFSFVANIASWLLSLFGIPMFQNIQIIGRPNSGLSYYLGFAIGLYLSIGAGANA
jgi:hypothetical protein